MQKSELLALKKKNMKEYKKMIKKANATQNNLWV